MKLTKSEKMTEPLAHGYSSESTQRPCALEGGSALERLLILLTPDVIIDI